MIRMDPCLNPACQALNVRRSGTLAPTACPKCGGPLLTPRQPVPAPPIVSLESW